MKNQYDKARMGKIVLVLFTVCALLYVALLFGTNQRVVKYDVTGCEVAEEGRMTYKIEKISCNYNYIKITGYAYEAGVSVDKADTTLLACDPVSGTCYKLPTENVKKTKLTEEADDGFNYDYAQFQSVTLRKKIPAGCRVCILYQGNGANILIPTDQVIFY